jgi:hypothetical protein
MQRICVRINKNSIFIIHLFYSVSLFLYPEKGELHGWLICLRCECLNDGIVKNIDDFHQFCVCCITLNLWFRDHASNSTLLCPCKVSSNFEHSDIKNMWQQSIYLASWCPSVSVCYFVQLIWKRVNSALYQLGTCQLGPLYKNIYNILTLLCMLLR